MDWKPTEVWISNLSKFPTYCGAKSFKLAKTLKKRCKRELLSQAFHRRRGELGVLHPDQALLLLLC